MRFSCFTGIAMLLLSCSCRGGTEEDHGDGHEETITNEKYIEMYKGLLHQKRLDQRSAVQQIAEIETYDKQYSMIQILLQKMVSVISENVIKLREAGYAPGYDFPTEENDREALSLVIENTALFGDMLLRLPDITHSLLRSNGEWDSLLKSSVRFVNMTGILQEVDGKLLNLMAQELELVERDPNYINPFKESNMKEMDMEDGDTKTPEGQAQKKKLNPKKSTLKRGPRISGQRIDL